MTPAFEAAVVYAKVAMSGSESFIPLRRRPANHYRKCAFPRFGVIVVIVAVEADVALAKGATLAALISTWSSSFSL